MSAEEFQTHYARLKAAIDAVFAAEDSPPDSESWLPPDAESSLPPEIRVYLYGAEGESSGSS